MGKNKEYHVLLIAMSGVRVKDKELLELGMTLPGFVDRSRVIASLPKTQNEISSLCFLTPSTEV